MFETYIIQPIFNVLLILHTSVGDFGVAIILFTILIRALMWPLLRKQLHQGRLIRKLQPKIKEIRKRNKGDRQKEAKQLSELYKKNGISTFGSLGLLFVQLPVFFGLFSALRSIIENPERIISLPYGFIASNSQVQDMMSSVAQKATAALNFLQDGEAKQQLIDRFGDTIEVAELQALSKAELHDLFTVSLAVDSDGASRALVQGPFFTQELLGVIDLSGRAITDSTIYIPVLVISILAGIFQYLQTKQITTSNPSNGKQKTLREIMKAANEKGEQPDQSEITAAMNKRLGLFFAPLITIISATSPSGLALYFASSGLVGLLQQRRVLHEDVEEMELVADVVEDNEKRSKAASSKQKNKSKSGGTTSKTKKGGKKKKGR